MTSWASCERSTRSSGGKPIPSSGRLQELASIARELKDAMLESRKSAPGSEKYVEAIERADAVVGRLADLVVITDAALPVLLVAGERIRRSSQEAWREKRRVWFYGRKGRG